MERTIRIDGRQVRLRSSAAIPRLYRIKFRRDIIQDMQKIRVAMDREAEKHAGPVSDSDTGPGENQGSTLSMEALTLFENVAYLMAYHADPKAVPDNVDAWLDTFETFSIYQVFPVIQELWDANMQTLNQPKKKSRRRRGR